MPMIAHHTTMGYRGQYRPVMRNAMIQDMIREAHARGFDVYAPETLTSYFYITNGKNIGYCQYDRTEGETFSTVHRPCQHNGTGFGVDCMEQTFIFSPSWASRATDIKKYKDFAEFQNKHWQALIQY